MSCRRALIIDDSSESVLVLSSLLREEHLDVRFALSGEEGLNLARQQAPDVILLDIEMDGMSGIEVCRQLKQEPGLQDVPVIFVSGHESEAVQLEALSVGAADFISKPFNPAITKARARNQLAMKQMTDRLKNLATLDALTGLANRRLLDERLNQEWHRAQRLRCPVSMIMVDVDFFKQFNDHYGHSIGDDCLRNIADCIRSVARRATDVAARYGGEEFCILLPETNLSRATERARSLQEAIESLCIPHERSDDGIVTVSAGVASIVPRQTDPASLVVEMADKALYSAKRAGRNRVAANL